MIIKFEVLGEPVAKGRPRFFRRGNFVGTYTDSKTRNAETDLKSQAIRHAPKLPIEGAISLEIKVYKGILKSFSAKKRIAAESGLLRPETRPDWDNYGKLVCDALNGIFWRDDSQVVDAWVRKYYSERPRIEVSISYEENAV